MLQLIWFSTILRVAYRVLTGGGAEDARSDDEEYACFVFLPSQGVRLSDLPPAMRMKITKRKTSEHRDVRLPHSTGYSCLPYLTRSYSPFVYIIPQILYVDLKSPEESCGRLDTGRFRRVTRCDSITSLPAATLPKGLCLFTFAICAYILSRNQRN